TAELILIAPVQAHELAFLQRITAFIHMNQQEIAALTTALSLLVFSAVSAILLMGTRVRAAKSDAKLRGEIRNLQSEADRFRALLFAEPQILIAWPAGDAHPQITSDTSLLIPQESPQRILAFGTWLPVEQAQQMARAVNALRETGEGFLLNLTTIAGVLVEITGRAI